jgi:hypothetical protein
MDFRREKQQTRVHLLELATRAQSRTPDRAYAKKKRPSRR